MHPTVRSVSRLSSGLCLACLFIACSSVIPSNTPSNDSAGQSEGLKESGLSGPQQEFAPPVRTTLRIKAVGDVMLGTSFPDDWLPPQNANLLSVVAPILRDADITFGNYEGTLLDGGEPAKQCKNPKRCYVFRTPPSYVDYLVEAGFDVMSLANNHARDFGDEGRISSMNVLAQAGIHHSGVEGDVATWQVNNKKILLIAFAPFRGANNPLEIERAAAWIYQLESEFDVVIISMHMGAEGEEATRLTFGEEMFHGENRGDMVAFSRAMIDAGADLVLGHGPHVPRAIELYEGRLIAYSLGNFCTYFGINVRGNNGLAPILDVTLYDDGEFKAGRIISAVQKRPYGPVLDADQQAARLMSELTRQDFPEGELDILADGQIVRKAFEPPLKSWVE